MTDTNQPNRGNMTFAQAEGAEPLPEPLKLNEVSKELRALLWNVFYDSLVKNLERDPYSLGRSKPWVGGDWETILSEKHVQIDHKMADDFSSDFALQKNLMRTIFEKGDYVKIFDFVQFVLRHRKRPYNLDKAVAAVLARSRAAYILVDGRTIYPKVSEQEGAAIQQAFADLAKYELNGARSHLRTAGELLNKGQYADSIRESVHAVEAVARILDPNATTLGPALAALEKQTAIHPALKSGFSAIYGYTSDEKGIRHSLVDDPKAPVDIADAVFMIGACASFISYLIAKADAAGIDVRKVKAAGTS